MLNQVVELKREVTAVQIPSGDVLTLPEGERVYITQILGGSYTVATDHGLARISREGQISTEQIKKTSIWAAAKET